jgi:hypothetical protein
MDAKGHNAVRQIICRFSRLKPHDARVVQKMSFQVNDKTIVKALDGMFFPESLES